MEVAGRHEIGSGCGRWRLEEDMRTSESVVLCRCKASWLTLWWKGGWLVPELAEAGWLAFQRPPGHKK